MKTIAPDATSDNVFEIPKSVLDSINEESEKEEQRKIKLNIVLMAKMINNMFCYFSEKYNLNENDDTYTLDTKILLDICERYFRDVKRLHIFHSINKIDRHKIAGYVTYWICKLRPIKINNKSAYENEYALYINEIFSFYVAFGRINYYLKSQGRKGKLNMNVNFYTSLFYDLRYRPTSGDNLSIMYYLTEQCFIDIVNSV